MKKGVLRNFTKFTGKHLCQSLLFNEVAAVTLLKRRLWYGCFPLNFVKFLITLFLQNTSGWLFLIFVILTWIWSKLGLLFTFTLWNYCWKKLKRVDVKVKVICAKRTPSRKFYLNFEAKVWSAFFKQKAKKFLKALFSKYYQFLFQWNWKFLYFSSFGASQIENASSKIYA